MVKIAVYLFCFLFCLLGLRHELKSQINTFPYNEGFEAVTGDWTNQTDDDMDWTTNQGGTPTGASGPAGANGGTKYLYTEASGFNHPSKRAYLEAEFDFTGIFHPQLSFFYHMYGAIWEDFM
jgi:hypothetical protein